MIKEYGGKEKYKSKGAMKKHEKGESKAMEKKERKMPSYQKGGMVFKPCPGCPTPAKCKAAGKCLMKGKKA